MRWSGCSPRRPSGAEPDIRNAILPAGLCNPPPCTDISSERHLPERNRMSRNAMQRLSFYLLVLVTLYASLAGAG